MDNVVYLTPIVSLLAGLLILFVPKILNYVVGAYLVIIGVLGLLPHVLG